jgi:hypothetical protein
VGIQVTAFAVNGALEAVLGAGFRRVPPKPVDFNHLLPFIEEVIGSP